MAARYEDLLPAIGAEDLGFGRWLFAQECVFLRGVVKMDGLPPADHPEIAFAGRSNVGKSSLVNALTGRKTLARVSNTPGRTRELNFFQLAGALNIVDLPGYGYARIERKLSDQWTKLIFSYLRGRATLKRVILLIDGRHGIKDSDNEAMEALDEAAVSYQLVLTKCDKLKTAELERMLRTTQERAARHGAAHPIVVPTSSELGLGIPELRALAAAASGLEPATLPGYKPAT
ncbi:MAG: YihA family ribosome biogenesis GTP-binding protein [Alphaproteobacteria bacterium]|nr:YihA family ribosome biogenesis GTP-binding protein [Alphaproteobacteria bacterium]